MKSQPIRADGGIEAIATLADVSQKIVKDKFGKLKLGGMLPDELEKVMGEFFDWKAARTPTVRPMKWAAKHPAQPAIAITQNVDGWHVVAIRDGKILVPYPEHHWSFAKLYILKLA